jgi:hypothetical protein
MEDVRKLIALPGKLHFQNWKNNKRKTYNLHDESLQRIGFHAAADFSPWAK